MGTGKLTQRVRTSGAFANSPSLLPYTHIAWFTTTLVSRDLMTSLDSVSTGKCVSPYLHVHVHTHQHIHTYIGAITWMPGWPLTHHAFTMNLHSWSSWLYQGFSRGLWDLTLAQSYITSKAVGHISFKWTVRAIPACLCACVCRCVYVYA